jgi:ABC-type arginine transport system ATPase subunit
MLAFVSNPLMVRLFLRIFMSQICRLEMHVNAVMGDADLKHLSYSDLQHPSPKSVKLVRLANNFCLSHIKGLPGPPHVLANCRLLRAIGIAFPDLFDSLTRDLHIQSNLFCSHTLLLLPDNPVNLALVLFHNSCYGFRGKACAKYFRDYTSQAQKQRVALARALIIETRLLLLDEPLSALDVRKQAALRKELRETISACGVPCIIVTHDLGDVACIGDHAFLLERGKLAFCAGAQEFLSWGAGMEGK